MPWSLVTLPDERERCCFVDEHGARCEQRSAFRVSGDAWDDYTYCCSRHLETVLASSPGMKAEPVAD